MNASYQTARPTLTPESLAEGTIDPPRAAMAVEWEPGQEEAALTEAASAYESVIRDIISSLTNRLKKI